VTWKAIPLWVRDVGLAGGLSVYTVLQPDLTASHLLTSAPRTLRLLSALTVVVLFVALVRLQHRRPLLAILAVALTAAAFLINGILQPVPTLALLLLFYTYATVTSRSRLAWTVAGVCSSLYLAGAFGSGGDWLSWNNVGALDWVGLGAAFGSASRNHRAYTVEVEDRARRAEESRDEEAARRVVEERMRIARELHDLVAHHIAVIKVQASGAKHVLGRRPELVEPSLDHISRSADEVLREIASLVGLLRTRDEQPAQDTTPTSGMSRLPVLLDDLACAGLRVVHQQTGVDRGLPAVVDLAAFRIVQEALTNAHKYGDGSAELRVEYTPQGVRVQVSNPVRPRLGGPRAVAGPAGGFGILGMRERATATGGSLTAGLDHPGTFVVRAQLPAVMALA
jgi:signal transduction histidine kinase